MLQQDPRNYQILFLSLFLILGIGTRDWTLRPDLILIVTITCLLTQWVAVSLWSNPREKIMTWLKAKGIESFIAKFQVGNCNIKFCNSNTHLQLPIASLTQDQNSSEKENLGLVSFSHVTSLKSAMITALSLSLLLRADHYTTMILAGSLAILSKFLFQFKHKHFFNPANFGIIAALLLTHDAWVSPGQWGEDGWCALLFAGTGGLVLKRVGRWDTTVAFLGAYTLLEAIRNLWLGWTWDVFSHRLMSGSLLLFALFMITDPRSIPNTRISRMIWAGCIAILTFILRNNFFIPTSVFWALFALSPLIVILDLIWSSSRFSWDETSVNNIENLADSSKLKPLSLS
ncbi:RnfABCDGE type electron transport complex subunit D [Allocoleopsis franciscana]|uniref:Na+-transporting NADH:ubiquinone oxidoreductase, subunit NqrB n=1 Tax=Allocoleopsis franciscana PCC 7113 TaxID=1173027 RepID=K9W705_9CYAN|nr:RnfABCDGE type electron transport complex subunit D [Allocoleopsis franciscana]AFZ16150.1 Na+-transporting NADH:ubiquinone oxidoreductase, subunit NqrB [Allocoleopsis franciscana PCC 7113]